MTLDRSAIEALYQSHGHVVRRRAKAMLGDDEEARDMTQQIFTQLLQRPEMFHGKSKASTFLYVVTTNACLQRIRDRKNRARILVDHVTPALQRASTSSARSEQLAIVRDLLARASDEVAEVAVYAYVDEMSQDEIASAIGKSRRQVAKLLDEFRALAARFATSTEGAPVEAA